MVFDTFIQIHSPHKLSHVAGQCLDIQTTDHHKKHLLKISSFFRSSRTDFSKVISDVNDCPIHTGSNSAINSLGTLKRGSGRGCFRSSQASLTPLWGPFARSKFGILPKSLKNNELSSLTYAYDKH